MLTQVVLGVIITTETWTYIALPGRNLYLGR
jgi:hypothetical protein